MKRKREFEEAFKVVKAVIDKANPYSLIEEGVPDDEFDSESKAIVRQLPRCKTPRDISHTIARVLNSSFNDKFKAEEFENEGKEIYHSLKELGLIE